jgi:hypothetical protein
MSALNGVQQGWVDVYKTYRKHMQEAPDGTTKIFWESQIKQIQPTLEALDIKDGDLGEPPSSAGAAMTISLEIDGWTETDDSTKKKPQSPGMPPSVQAPPAQQASPNSPNGEAVPGGTKMTKTGNPALDQWSDQIEKASAATGVPANLLAAVMWDESRGQLAASSQNGQSGADTGLMQMGAVRFNDLKAKHPELAGMSNDTAAGNVMAAAFFLKDLKGTFGSWDLALRGYNSGELSVDMSNPNNIKAQSNGQQYGDPAYITKVHHILDAIMNGQQLPP